MRNFEVFKGRAKPVTSKIMRAALNRKGSFSLNHAAFTALSEPKAVELLFDPESRAIGIRPSDETVRHAYPVRTQKNSKSYLIAAQAFVKFYELDLPNTVAFEPKLEDGILVLELDTAIDASRQQVRRNGKGAATAPETTSRPEQLSL